MFNRAFLFNGRIKRTEYGISFIIYWTSYGAIKYLTYDAGENNNMRLIGLLIIPMLWFLWSQGAKRCHDLGKNGWWQIIPFYFFWLLFEKGSPWPNQYDIPGSDVFYDADDYEMPFDINEPVQSPVINVQSNDIIPPASNE